MPLTRPIPEAALPVAEVLRRDVPSGREVLVGDWENLAGKDAQ